MEVKVRRKEPKLDLTDKQRTKFIEMITDGVPTTTALKGNNIPEKKFYYWKSLVEQIKDIKVKDNLNNTEFYIDTDVEECNIKLKEKVNTKNTYAHDIVEFIEEYEQAKTDFVHNTLALLRKADKTEWSKYAWLLERTQAHDFGRKDPDKQMEEKKVSKIQVEFVDAKTDDKRLAEMEKIVQEEVLGKKENEKDNI